MATNPREFDPLDPRADAVERPRTVDPLAYDPVNPVPPAPRSSARAGLVLLAMVAALFVIGFIAFSGDPGVDSNPTATIPSDPAIQTQPIAPSPAQPPAADAPAAAPAPATPAPAN